MPTTKRRINICTDKQTEMILKKIAKRDGVPLATKVSQLLMNALEIEEDLALGVIAEKRLALSGKRIPHHLAWK